MGEGGGEGGGGCFGELTWSALLWGWGDHSGRALRVLLYQLENTRSSSGRNNGKVFSPFLLAQKNPLLFMQQPAEKLPLNLRRGCVWLEDIATCHAQPNLSCALASCFQILVIVFNGQHMSERCCVCIPCVLLVFMWVVIMFGQLGTQTHIWWCVGRVWMGVGGESERDVCIHTCIHTDTHLMVCGKSEGEYV